MDNEQQMDTDRGRTHGDYDDMSRVVQMTKDVWREHGVNWNKLTMGQREALELIATKVGRILTGDPTEPDHWSDVSGYAKLGRKSINAGER